jgi:hypothetical protein
VELWWREFFGARSHTSPVKTVFRKSVFAALPIQFNHKIKKKLKVIMSKLKVRLLVKLILVKKGETTDWKTLLQSVFIQFVFHKYKPTFC